MAEIQQWRRLVQHRRSRTDLNNLVAETEKIETASVTSTTSFQARSEAESRPHPKSRFASYLSTHRTPALTEKLEDPAFNWAPPKDRDSVHDPDLEAMCNTLRGRVLKFPSKDLPAPYNSFILHLVEGYQNLLAERKALQLALDKQIPHEQGNLEKHPDTSSHKVRGRRSLEPVLSVEDPRWPKEMRGSEENGTVSKLKEHVVTRGWQRSPSRGMARLSQRLLKINNDTDHHPSTSVLGAGHPRGPLSTGRTPSSPHGAQTRNSHRTSESDNSSTVGDLLPDEQEEEQSLASKKNTQIAIHLASWLAHRTGSDLDAVYPEIAEIISAYSTPESGPLQIMCFGEGKPSSAQTTSVTLPATDTRMKHPTTYKSDEIVAVHFENQHKDQRSRFSFLPGDDVDASHIAGSRSNNLSVVSLERQPGKTGAGIGSNTKDNGREREYSGLDEGSGVPVGSAYKGSSQPRREDSNRSVLTAINNGSYSVATGPPRASSSNSGTAKNSSRVISSTKKDSFAAAAARLAGQNKAEPK
ncbi:hypothetical protein MMC26_007735 [Xylographa opegraphella]|nr:hypothetical protein [Xylographa opegraphella]